jgi:hypothetical protein
MKTDKYRLGCYEVIVQSPDDISNQRSRTHAVPITAWCIHDLRKEYTQGSPDFTLQFFPLFRRGLIWGKEVLPSFISYYVGTFAVTIKKEVKA